MAASRAQGQRIDLGRARQPSDHRGRPRDADVDQRVLSATLDLLAEVGHSRLTIRAVAARAGVGHGSIYRRWETKDELVLAALRALQDAPPPSSGTGDATRQFLQRMRHAMTGPHAALVPTFVLAMRTDPLYAEIARAAIMLADRGALKDEILRRAGGRITDEMAMLIADLGPSLVFTRVLVMDETPTDAELDALSRFVDILVRELADEPTASGAAS